MFNADFESRLLIFSLSACFGGGLWIALGYVMSFIGPLRLIDKGFVSFAVVTSPVIMTIVGLLGVLVVCGK